MRMRPPVLVVAAAFFSLSCSDGRYRTPTDAGTSHASADAQQGDPIRSRAVRSKSSTPSLLGKWGGEHIGLDMQAGSGRLEFDCAHGTIDEPIVLAADGTFSVRGTFTRERGGPVTETDVENIRPARYRGKTSGDKMDLNITIDGAEGFSENFALVKDQFPRIVKCL